jgi:hypothetical protein
LYNRFTHGASGEKYQLGLRGLFETVPLNGHFNHEVPGSRISFSNVTWDFQAPRIAPRTTDFTITGTVERLRNATKPRFGSLIITNTIARHV